jgi:hypothetical protein
MCRQPASARRLRESNFRRGKLPPRMNKRMEMIYSERRAAVSALPAPAAVVYARLSHVVLINCPCSFSALAAAGKLSWIRIESLRQDCSSSRSRLLHTKFREGAVISSLSEPPPALSNSRSHIRLFPRALRSASAAQSDGRPNDSAERRAMFTHGPHLFPLCCGEPSPWGDISATRAWPGLGK